MKKITPETGALETAGLETNSTRILLATLAAFVIAALILAAIILPAEFNKDPLGVGQRLGILGLSTPATSNVETVHKEKIDYREDAVSFQLLPFEFVEYKYQLNEGSALLYNWASTNTVSFEFHGEPEGGPEGFAESYNLGEGNHGTGTFTAPFNGIHGWFWANRSSDTVTVKLNTAGFYTATLEFRDGSVKKQVLNN
jgi:hypothetical protein